MTRFMLREKCCLQSDNFLSKRPRFAHFISALDQGRLPFRNSYRLFGEFLHINQRIVRCFLSQPKVCFALLESFADFQINLFTVCPKIKTLTSSDSNHTVKILNNFSTKPYYLHYFILSQVPNSQCHKNYQVCLTYTSNDKQVF